MRKILKVNQFRGTPPRRPDWSNKDKVVDPECSGLLPSEMDEAVKGAMEAGAAGVCLFMPSRMSEEHWEALSRTLR